jgi:hypothetical protein
VKELQVDLPEIMDYITKAKYLPEESVHKAYQAAYLENKNLVVIANEWKVRENIAILAILNALTHSKKGLLYLNPIPTLITRFYNRLQPILTLIGAKVSKYSCGILDTDVVLAIPKDIKEIPVNTSLIIVDELETLEDYSGLLMKSIIVKAKTIPGIRLIGLSTYVPNYNDLAVLLEGEIYVMDSVELGFTFYGKEIFRVQDLCSCILDDFNRQFVIFRPSAGDVLDCISPLLGILKAKGIEEHLDYSLERVFTKYHNEGLEYGVGVLCDSMEHNMKNSLIKAFSLGHLKILVAEIKCAWNIPRNPNASVIIGGITYFNYYAKQEVSFSEPELYKAITCGSTCQIIVPRKDLLLATGIIAHQRCVKTIFQLPLDHHKEVENEMIEENLRKIEKDFSLDEQTVAYLSYYIQVERNPLKLLPLATVSLNV